MPFMHEDEQEVDVMCGWILVDTDTDIAEPFTHVHRHLDGEKKGPALPKKLQKA